METVGIKFDGKNNNFDVVRLCAASLVVCSHSFSFVAKREPFAQHLGGYDTGGGIAVAIFFVISGFLIARSCLEREFVVYCRSRVFRIIPALCGLLLFDIFIIGPIFTSLTYAQYFKDPMTWLHLANASVFYQSHQLPGVFGGAGVNGTIWTLPIEAACYIFLPFLMAMGFLRRWHVLVPLALIGGAYWWADHTGLAWANQGGSIAVGLPLFSTLKNALFFIIGSAMWVHRNDIPISNFGAAAALFLLYIGSFGYCKMLIFYIALPYLTIYICLYKYIGLNLHKICGDLSYGIYLYGYPAQMALINYFGFQRLPLLLTLCSLLITFPIAIISWKYIEYPSLQRLRYTKKRLDSVVPA